MGWVGQKECICRMFVAEGWGIENGGWRIGNGLGRWKCNGVRRNGCDINHPSRDDDSANGFVSSNERSFDADAC